MGRFWGGVWILLLACGWVQAQPTPQQLTVQGFLEDASGGTPVVVNGVVEMRFELFDAEMGGLALAAYGPVDVTVQDGRYNVTLPFPAGDFSDGSRFLEVQVEGEVLTPRFRIASVPFAYVAQSVEGFTAADLDQSGDLATATVELQTQIDALVPAGQAGAVPFKNSASAFVADSTFTYDDAQNRLAADQARFLSLTADADRVTLGDPVLRQPTDVLGPLAVRDSATIRQRDETFYCAFDWDADGQTQDDADDLVLCLDAAKAFAGNSGDGSDGGARVLIPSGTYDLCAATTCPYELYGGMALIGSPPRTHNDILFVAPDLDLNPNGGTWIDGSSSNDALFVGTDLRNLQLHHLGFLNWGSYALDLGPRAPCGQQAGITRDDFGPAFAQLTDLMFLGDDDSYAAMRMTNFQHVYGERWKARNVDVGYHFRNNTNNWQGGNSVIVDAYVNAQRDWTHSGQKGFWLQACDPGVNLNYLTFIRPQVNDFRPGAGEPGTRLFDMEGGTSAPVQGMTIIGADLEGNAQYGFYMHGNNTNHYIDIAHAQLGTAPGTYGLYADSDSGQSVFHASSGGIRAYNASAKNMFSGNWGEVVDGTPAGMGHFGVYRNASAAEVAVVGSRFEQRATRDNVETTQPVTGFDQQLTYESKSPAAVPFVGIDQSVLYLPREDNSRAEVGGTEIEVRTAGSISSSSAVVDALYALALSTGFESTGAGDYDVHDAVALQIGATLSGQGHQVDEYAYLRMTTPGAMGVGAEITEFYGLRVDDLGGRASTVNHAFYLAPQDANPGGDRGNLVLAGTGHDRGHLVLGGWHLWDPADGTAPRVSPTPPTSDGDGDVVVVGTGRDSDGVLKWGDADILASDTADKVCQLSGMTCVIGLGFDGTEFPCADRPEVTVSGFFYALCK